MLRAGLRETLLVLDDVWEASVAEAFERVGLSLLVTTREVMVGYLGSMFLSSEYDFLGVAGARLYDGGSLYDRNFMLPCIGCLRIFRVGLGLLSCVAYLIPGIA